MTWEYIAGFFDGEGSISHNGNGYRITIPQTNQEVLNDIMRFSGVGFVVKITKRRAHWKDSWVYYISRQKDVYFFIKHIAEFLKVKKNAAETVMSILEGYLADKERHDIHLDKMKDIAARMRGNGCTYREIGKKIGLDWSYVRRILIKRR
jgi:hypothetical protein